MCRNRRRSSEQKFCSESVEHREKPECLFIALEKTESATLGGTHGARSLRHKNVRRGNTPIKRASKMSTHGGLVIIYHLSLLTAEHNTKP